MLSRFGAVVEGLAVTYRRAVVTVFVTFFVTVTCFCNITDIYRLVCLLSSLH